MKTFFSLLLLVAMATGIQCTHKDRSDNDNKEHNTIEQTPDSVVLALPQIDSADIYKYLSFDGRKELGPALDRFYKQRDYHIAWFANKIPSANAMALMNRIRNAAAEGLNPADYKVDLLEKKVAEVNKPGIDEQKVLDLDILFSTEFCNYAIDMKEGITRQQKDKIGWYISESKIKYDSLLNIAIRPIAEGDPLDFLEPNHAQYSKLKTILASYRAIDKKGGWPAVTGTEKLILGDTSSAVGKLRERLSMTGDLQQGASNFYAPKIFDKNLELGVKNFQTRHGLEPDGIVAGHTLKALNMSVKQRIVQVLVNMDRWRQVPQDMGNEYYMVNVPEFKLHIIKDNKQVMDMRVIVGKDYKATPIFSDHLQNVVFSPYWNIPKSIIAEDVLPGMRKDPSYLNRHDMEAMKGFGKDAIQVNAWQVPWYNIGNDNFQYWVRQRPGDKNPLGLVKFLFPNSYNVYLHGTSQEGLFKHVKRSFSHGCIRVENPLKLAEYSLSDQSSWTKDRIWKAMHSNEEQFVKSRNIPVYILYFTIWQDANGKVQIRDDLYGLDKSTAEHMNLSPSLS